MPKLPLGRGKKAYKKYKIKEGLKYGGNIYNMLMENAFDIPL